MLKYCSLWDLRTGAIVRTIDTGHTGGLACFSWDGNRCVTGGNDLKLRMWDMDTGECLLVMQGHDKMVRCVAFDRAANRIVSGAYDKVCLDPSICGAMTDGMLNRMCFCGTPKLVTTSFDSLEVTTAGCLTFLWTPLASSAALKTSAFSLSTLVAAWTLPHSFETGITPLFRLAHPCKNSAKQCSMMQLEC